LYWVKGVLEVMSGLGAQNRLVDDSATGRRAKIEPEAVLCDEPAESTIKDRRGWLGTKGSASLAVARTWQARTT
jgi:hypothetical protein